MRAATKSRDAVRRDTLRFALSAVHNDEVARRTALRDEDVVGVLAKQAKMRRESIEAFAKGGRTELVEKERAELAVLESYLPQQLSTEEVRELARDAITEAGATGPSDQGKVMQRLMPKVRGRADGTAVAEIVGTLLRGGA